MRLCWGVPTIPCSVAQLRAWLVRGFPWSIPRPTARASWPVTLMNRTCVRRPEKRGPSTFRSPMRRMIFSVSSVAHWAWRPGKCVFARFRRSVNRPIHAHAFAEGAVPRRETRGCPKSGKVRAAATRQPPVQGDRIFEKPEHKARSRRRLRTRRRCRWYQPAIRGRIHGRTTSVPVAKEPTARQARRPRLT